MRRLGLILFAFAAGGCSLIVSLGDLTPGGDAATDDATSNDVGTSDVTDAGNGDDAQDASPLDATNFDAFFASIGCAAQPDLLAYYLLDETVGAIVHDCYSATNNGKATVYGTPWDIGKISGSLGFRINDSGCANVGFATPTFDFGGTPAPVFSVTAWIHLLSAPAVNDIAFIVGKGHNIVQSGWRVAVRGGSNNLSFAIPDGDGGTATAVSPVNLADSAWHHIAAVYSGTSSVVYVDGVSGISIPTPTGFAKDPTTTDELQFGCSSDEQHPLAGDLDDVRIYTRALSIADVMAIFTAN